MKKHSKLFCLLAFAFICFLQVSAQDISLKSNTLYWGMLAPNLSVEFPLNKRYTADLQMVYRPWRGHIDGKLRFWLAQPEVRYWFCEPSEGHFMGVHLHGGQYYRKNHQQVYDGYLVGSGLSYGYQWILSPHWSLEAQIGAGYAYLWYDQRPDLPCKKCNKSKHKNYFGPTKAALSLVYVF